MTVSKQWRKQKHWPQPRQITHWPYPFFTHHWTPDGRALLTAQNYHIYDYWDYCDNKHNCVLSNAGLFNAPAKTGICTSLKSNFYFRFHSPLNTKSALLNFICTSDLALTCWKMRSPESENCPNQNPHTSKIAKLLPVCLTNDRRRSDQISELHAKFREKSVKNGGLSRLTTDLLTDTQTDGKNWLEGLSNALDRQLWLLLLLQLFLLLFLLLLLLLLLG